MRFVHVADVHLDTPFSSRSPTVRDRLREATRQAFEAAVSLALEREVHAFLIAGDLFDGDRVSFQTESFLLSTLSRLTEAGIRVVYATGNHDPGAPGFRSLEMAWPDGVSVVADPSPRRIQIVDGAGEAVGFVTAAGHDTTREGRDLSRDFPRPAGDLPEVALLHTQVVGSVDGEAHHAYAPSTLEGLRGAGYDYWALGHVHHRQALSPDPAIHYPGNPQGRTPRENGPRGGLLVDLAPGARPSVSFQVLGPVRWARIQVADLEGRRNLDELVTAVEEVWTSSPGARAAAPSETLLQLTLSGASPLWRMLAEPDELEALAEAVATHLGLLWVDILPPRVHRLVTVEEHVGRPDVLGEALRLVDRTANGEEAWPDMSDRELAASSLGGLDDRASYLSGLLDGAQEELLSRMLRAAPDGEDGTS